MMKKMILASLLVSSSVAFAAPAYLCESKDYTVYISKNRNALVEKGATIAATLTCSDDSTPGADFISMTCSEREIVDAGYSVKFMKGGFTGAATAEVSTQSILGAKPLTALNCRSVD